MEVVIAVQSAWMCAFRDGWDYFANSLHQRREIIAVLALVNIHPGRILPSAA